MSSRSAVANLNQIALGTWTSPRKRARTSDGQDSSNKKRAVDPEARASGRAGRPRKSTTQLPTPRASTAADHAPQSSEITIHPPVSPGKPRNEVQEPKKKRRLGGKDKGNKSSPFKGKGIIGRVSVAGVNFNAPGSPVKATRRRGKADAASNAFVNAPANPLTALNAHPIQFMEPARRHATNTTQLSARPGSARRTGRAVSIKAPDANPATQTSEIEEQGAESQSEESSGEDAGEEEQPDIAKPQEGVAADVDEHQDQDENEDGNEDDMREEGNEPEHRTNQEPAASEPRRRRKGRAPRTQEELQKREEKRKAQKEAEERRRKEDIEEANKAQQEEIDMFKEKFGRGLERAAEEIGGIDTWKNLGAGAFTIKDMAPRKREMDTNRAQSIWRKLVFLDEAFQQLEYDGDYVLQDEEGARTALRDLKARSTLDFLRPKRDQQQRGDLTAVELYQQIIPKVAILLKKVLLGRYVDGLSVEGAGEILTLSEAGMQLCNIAMEWEPKPSALSSGTRRAVHNYINPSLRTIRNCLADRMKYEEHVFDQKQRGKKLAQDQKESRERKLKLWAETQRRFASHHAMANYHHTGRHIDESDTVNIDDFEEERPPQRFRNEDRPRPRRQVTEEIPAPDPSTQWTREEDVALLDSLQQFHDGDRFGQVLATCPQLQEKDIFQLMARAQFHKQNNCKAIKAAEKRGDPCFDWLSSV